MGAKEWMERSAKEIERENRRNSNDLWVAAIIGVILVFGFFRFGIVLIPVW